ncbi:carbohydrate-binding module 1 [Zalaria obscura]|uniref:Carbohydrate-binding module 1 n=1 Tax=Zalaria obscura TaxID=2024903 RepID=A0ACC3SN71_9PEZI
MKFFLSASVLFAGIVATTARKTCGNLPKNIHLFNDTYLPDPFRFLNGQRVKNLKNWQCREAEVSALFQRYELGTKPPRPSHLSASYASNNLTITAGENGNYINWTVSITYPNTTSTTPYPAVIALDALSIPVPDGAAVIIFNNDEIGQQNNQSSRGVGLFYDLYGHDASASSMMAWAWAISRIIDALEMTPAAHINPHKLAVTGCSRDGKGAMVAGAFDDRIALTIAQESGSGGDACWRISDAELRDGLVTQTASEIVTENVWFSVEFDRFANDTDLLPFDHHQLAGLIAPRGLYATDNTDFVWLGLASPYGCMEAGRLIYESLGVKDHLGFSQDGNHSHCTFPPDQEGELAAFFDKFLFDDESADTDVLRKGGNYTFNLRDWVNWSVPRLY